MKKNKTINLIFPIGVPGTGKSTYIKNNYNNNQSIIIERDAIRESNGLGQEKKDHQLVTQMTIKMIKDVIIGTNEIENIIIDGTNLIRKQRINILTEIKRIAKKNNINIHVTAILFSAPLEVIEQNIKNRVINGGHDVPMHIVKRMMTSFNMPSDMCDCDELIFKPFVKKDTSILNLLEQKLSHNSIHHMEDVNTHIKMIKTLINKDRNKGLINDADADILIDVANFHDIGKWFTKQTAFAGSGFSSHENVSAYLALNYDYDIACISALHMLRHNEVDYEKNKHKYCLKSNFDKVDRLTTLFSKYDEKGIIKSPVCGTPIIINKKTFRKYIIRNDYVPMVYVMNMVNDIKFYDFSLNTVLDIFSEIERSFGLRTSIWNRNGELIAPGLPSFSNYNEMAFLDKVERSEPLNESQLYFIKLIQSRGQLKADNEVQDFIKTNDNLSKKENIIVTTKWDGSLIHFFKVNDEIHYVSRGSVYTNDLSSFGVNKNLLELLDELNINKNYIGDINPHTLVHNMNNGDAVFFELIGEDNQHVVQYSETLNLVPLIHIDGQTGESIILTPSINQYNKSDFIKDDVEEGWVIYDSNEIISCCNGKINMNKCVKVKLDDFIELHKYNDDWSLKLALSYITNENLDDIMHKLPKNNVNKFTELLELINNDIQNDKAIIQSYNNDLSIIYKKINNNENIKFNKLNKVIDLLDQNNCKTFEEYMRKHFISKSEFVTVYKTLKQYYGKIK